MANNPVDNNLNNDFNNDSVNNNPVNIILVGMIGVGKTAVGRMLAERLDYGFIDMDARMEQVTGLKLADIYHKYGAVRFYAEENLLLAKVSSNDGKVIAVGGALPPRDEQIARWSELGTVVWLQADAETILRRVRRKQNRFFLPRHATVQNVRDMIAERAPLYSRAAAYEIDLDRYALEQAVEMIADFCVDHTRLQHWG